MFNVSKHSVIFYAILGFVLVIAGIYLAQQNLLSGFCAGLVGASLINLSVYFVATGRVVK